MNISLITIVVKDLQKSLKFYKEILGFVETKSFSPREGVKIVFLKDQDSGTIELIEDKTKPKDEGDYGESRMSIGFEVTDMERKVKELIDKGVEIVRGPIEVPSGVKLAFIKDPNGVEIELIQEP